MNKIFSALLACVVAFSVFAGFAPEASAQDKHVYLNLESIACPDIQSIFTFYRYTLSWKSKDESPSSPEANEYKRFFPDEIHEGECHGQINVVNVNKQYQFPVDRDILLQPAIENTKNNIPFLLPPVVIPATRNLEGTETTFTEANVGKTIIKYKVTFE